MMLAVPVQVFAAELVEDHLALVPRVELEAAFLHFVVAAAAVEAEVDLAARKAVSAPCYRPFVANCEAVEEQHIDAAVVVAAA